MPKRVDPEIAAVAAAARQARIEQDCARIAELTARVPPKVLAGDHKRAVDWKAAAFKARGLASRQRINDKQLSDARVLLEQFE